MNDSELIKAYINGNEEAFGILVNTYKQKVLTTIYLIVKDSALAEDLMQDVFIKAIHTLKGGKYNEEGKFGPWIARIAHNLAIDYFRKNQRHQIFTLEENRDNISNNLNFSETSIENEKIKKDNILKLHALIEELPESQKEVLKMRHFSGMSFKDIADSTGVSINTALGRMRYALLNLRKEMEENEITISFE